VKVGAVALTLGGGGGALIAASSAAGCVRAGRPWAPMPPAAQQTLSDLGLGVFIAAHRLATATPRGLRSRRMLAAGRMGLVVTLVPLDRRDAVSPARAPHDPVVICGALAGAMTVDAAVTGCCEIGRKPDAGARRRRAYASAT